MVDIKSFSIGVLLAAAIVLGYIVYERQQRTIDIKLPTVNIEKG